MYDIEAKCFECDIKITESRQGKSVRLVSIHISLCAVILVDLGRTRVAAKWQYFCYFA